MIWVWVHYLLGLSLLLLHGIGYHSFCLNTIQFYPNTLFTPKINQFIEIEEWWRRNAQSIYISCSYVILYFYLQLLWQHLYHILCKINLSRHSSLQQLTTKISSKNDKQKMPVNHSDTQHFYHKINSTNSKNEVTRHLPCTKLSPKATIIFFLNRWSFVCCGCYWWCWSMLELKNKEEKNEKKKQIVWKWQMIKRERQCERDI